MSAPLIRGPHLWTSIKVFRLGKGPCRGDSCFEMNAVKLLLADPDEHLRYEVTCEASITNVQEVQTLWESLHPTPPHESRIRGHTPQFGLIAYVDGVEALRVTLSMTCHNAQVNTSERETIRSIADSESSRSFYRILKDALIDPEREAIRLWKQGDSFGAIAYLSDAFGISEPEAIKRMKSFARDEWS